MGISNSYASLTYLIGTSDEIKRSGGNSKRLLGETIIAAQSTHIMSDNPLLAIATGIATIPFAVDLAVRIGYTVAKKGVCLDEAPGIVGLVREIKQKYDSRK